MHPAATLSGETGRPPCAFVAAASDYVLIVFIDADASTRRSDRMRAKWIYLTGSPLQVDVMNEGAPLFQVAQD